MPCLFVTSSASLMNNDQSWKAATVYIHPISRLFRSLELKGARARFFVTPGGIKITSTAQSKTYTAQLYIDSSAFASYQIDNYDESDFQTTVSIDALVHCLQMFVKWSADDTKGSTTESALQSNQTGSSACFIEFIPNKQLQLKYASESMNSICHLTLYENDEFTSELKFDSEQVILQAIMPSAVLVNVFKDMAAVSSKEMTISSSVSPMRVTFNSSGDLVSTEFSLPNDPKVVEALSIDVESDFTYDFGSIIQSMNGIRTATKISLRYDVYGTLSIQCLCAVDEHEVYIEYKFLPKQI